MPNLRISLSEAELAWVKRQPRGFVRGLIQTAMHPETPEEKAEHALPELPASVFTRPPDPAAFDGVETRATVRGVPVPTGRKVRGPTCKHCGGMMLAGKCMVCNKIG